MRFGVEFRASEFRAVVGVWDFRFRALGFGIRVSGFRFRVLIFGFGVSVGFWFSVFGSRAPGSGIRGSGNALLDDFLDRDAVEHHRNRLKSISEVKI